MALQITKSGREFTHEIEGTTFTLYRPTQDEEAAMLKAHTRKGTLDWFGFSIAKLERCVRGWDELIVDGQKVPFDKALLKEFPVADRVRLLDAIDEGGLPLAKGSAGPGPS